MALRKGRRKRGKKLKSPRVAPATASILTTPERALPLVPHPPPPTDVDENGSPAYYEALLLDEFADVLVDELPNELPPLREVNHEIWYKGTKPYVAHKYRLSEDRKKALEEDIRKKLDSGVLEYSSDVPLAASHMVPKSEPGKYRHVQDLRKRNEDTESMAWPMPDQEELVHNVAQSDNNSVVDLISAFDQTRNELESEKYATIVNHMGVFKQRTIQQGDKNAVATHQRSMQHHTGDQWGENVTFYVDDGAIYDKKPGMSAYSHYLVCRRLLLNFRKYKFYLNRKKTKFFIDMKKDGVNLLGRHIQNGEISIAKPKVDAFLALGSPTSHQELGKDLGTFNWLTDHLPWAATVAAPLQELYHSAKWEWREVHENAFRRMKELIGGAEVLVPLDLREEVKENPERRIFVVSDASLSGGGGYICQGTSLETAKPAVYHSRVFTPAQTNYPVHEQELLALVDIVKSYEHWLLGRPFTAVTDSQAMLSLMKQKHLSPRQWRAMTYLSTFDIKFEFLPGKRNIIADLLSRIAERSTYQHDLPYLEESDETAVAAMQLRRGKTLLETPLINTRSHKSAPQSAAKPTSQPAALPTAATIPQSEPESSIVAFDLSGFCDAIIEGYKEDTQFKKSLKEGVESGVYVLKDGLLYTGPGRDELCIPNIKVNGGRDGGEKNLREMIISHFHDGTLGHFGAYKTAKGVRREFYWKTATEDIKKYARSCHICQTRKTSPTKQYGKNHPLPTPTKPWDQVSMDFLVNLPSSALNDQKFNSLFVVEDMLSKQCHLIPTTTNVKAEGVAKLYFDQIYRLHGLPRAIVSDRDTKFTGAFWRTLQKMVGTDLMMSTTDHPQTDGQTERTNRTILQILRAFVNQVGSDWAQHLAAVEFAINSAVSRSTGKAPFEIIYGCLPRSFPPIAFDHDNPASMDFMEDRMLAQLSAQESIIAAKTEQSYHVNKHRKEDPDITTGQDVVVSNESQLQHLPKGRQKLATKFVGPYKVLKVDKSKSNYTVEIPNSKRHPTFHVTYVKPYTNPQLDLFPNRQRRRPRIVTSEFDLNVEVDKLIGHQKRRDGSIQFLVLWEGYPAEDATFRDAELFRTSPYGIRVVEDYLATFGDLPEELDAWVAKTDWIKAKKPVGAVAASTEATAATVLIDTGASENYVRGDEESSALWIMLELGDVAGDSDEEDDFDYVDAWSKEGRM
jgi:RNase H-like domain found in reverse transcriptase/Integrase zinc binding domain/Chromo (CHRromatin Organisation MOdifier) domain